MIHKNFIPASVGDLLTLLHAEDPEEGQELGRNGLLIAVKGKNGRSEKQRPQFSNERAD